MAVLVVRRRRDGITPAQYDEISPPLLEKVKRAPGFMYHVAFVDGDGRFTVFEIWESQELHDRWFDENVGPHLHDVEREVLQVHAVHTP
jgi:hypothetical protein